MKELDKLTRDHTAFRDFNELINACRANGYVPTLMPTGRDGEAREKLAKAVEAEGYQVFRGVV